MDLSPYIKEALTIAPLPYPNPISEWYRGAQAWLKETHGIRATRQQLAHELYRLGYRRTWTKGFTNWALKTAP